MKRTKRDKKMPTCQGCGCTKPYQRLVFSTIHQDPNGKQIQMTTLKIDSNHHF